MNILKHLFHCINSSKECYNLRKEYKKLCIDRSDKEHEYAIEKAIKYNKLCGNLITKIKNRILKLNSVLLENVKLLDELS